MKEKMKAKMDSHICNILDKDTISNEEYYILNMVYNQWNNEERYLLDMENQKQKFKNLLESIYN